jgi:hypothetical protein
MDANAFRYLLIALASSVVVFLNFPWRSTARSMSRCAAALTAAPQTTIEQPRLRRFAR